MIARYKLLLTGIVWMLLLSCKNYKEPEYKEVKKFEIGKMGKEESTIKLDVLFFNPNNKKFKLKDAELDVYFDGQYIGHTHLDTTIEIPAKADFIVPVNLKVPMKDFIAKAAPLLLKKEVELHLLGTIKVGVSGFNKKIDIDFTGPQKLELSR